MSGLGVVVAVATGLVEVNQTNYKRLRREARRELRGYRISLQPWGMGLGQYRLISKGKKSGHRRLTHLGKDDFVTCCKHALKHITPSNPER